MIIFRSHMRFMKFCMQFIVDNLSYLSNINIFSNIIYKSYNNKQYNPDRYIYTIYIGYHFIQFILYCLCFQLLFSTSFLGALFESIAKLFIISFIYRFISIKYPSSSYIIDNIVMSDIDIITKISTYLNSDYPSIYENYKIYVSNIETIFYIHCFYYFLIFSLVSFITNLISFLFPCIIIFSLFKLKIFIRSIDILFYSIPPFI